MLLDVNGTLTLARVLAHTAIDGEDKLLSLGALLSQSVDI